MYIYIHTQSLVKKPHLYLLGCIANQCRCRRRRWLMDHLQRGGRSQTTPQPQRTSWWTPSAHPRLINPALLNQGFGFTFGKLYSDWVRTTCGRIVHITRFPPDKWPQEQTKTNEPYHIGSNNDLQNNVTFHMYWFCVGLLLGPCHTFGYTNCWALWSHSWWWDRSIIYRIV